MMGTAVCIRGSTISFERNELVYVPVWSKRQVTCPVHQFLVRVERGNLMSLPPREIPVAANSSMVLSPFGNKYAPMKSMINVAS
jgi:hypothetical protein